MNRVALALLHLLLISVLHAEPMVATDAENRTWTNAEGVTIEARLLEYDEEAGSIRIKRGNREFDLPVAKLSEKDHRYLAEMKAQNLAKAEEERKQEEERKMELRTNPDTGEFEVEVAKGKKVTVKFHDVGSDAFFVIIPGADQKKELIQGMFPIMPFLGEKGYSSIVLWTDFGPMIDHAALKQNVHFHKALEEIRERLDARRFILYGGSNGGMTAMQAVEKNLSKSDIVAVFAHPSVYIPKSGLKDLPVHLRLGALDELGWAEHYPRVVKELEASGADFDAELVEGEGHMPRFREEEVLPWLKEHGIEP